MSTFSFFLFAVLSIQQFCKERSRCLRDLLAIFVGELFGLSRLAPI